MKKAISVLLSMGLIVLTACSQNNAPTKETSPSSPGAPTPEATINQPSGSTNSVTFLKINGSYFPLSYRNNGMQILSDDVGPYSLLIDTLLQDIPSAESLGKIKMPTSHVSASSTERGDIYGLGPIASNGDWDFFPNKVSHQIYSFDNQPDQPDWTDYFRGKLDEGNYDGPIVITESFSFLWDGLETTVVTASNIIFSAENSDKSTEEDVCIAAVQPDNDVPNIYMISVLFVQGNTPKELFSQSLEIPKVWESRAQLGIGYVPWDSNYSLYTQYLSAVQYNELGEPSIFPLFCSHGGELNARDFKHLPQFTICDIDGDGQSELVMNITRNSSEMCFCHVYKLKAGIPVDAFGVTLN